MEPQQLRPIAAPAPGPSRPTMTKPSSSDSAMDGVRGLPNARENNVGSSSGVFVATGVSEPTCTANTTSSSSGVSANGHLVDEFHFDNDLDEIDLEQIEQDALATFGSKEDTEDEQDLILIESTPQTPSRRPVSILIRFA